MPGVAGEYILKNFFGIHPTAIVGDNVTLGEGVTIGPRAIVYDHVEIGDDCFVGADVTLGEPLSAIHADPDGYENPPLVIGAGSSIRSRSIIYAGSRFGPGLETGHRVTIRENTTAGTNLRVGTLSDIQGHCEFGEHVRLHSNVHIGQQSKVGDFVWIFPYVVLTNDPHPPSDFMMGCTVEDFAVIATMSVILPGVRIGQDALVGAGSIVGEDVDAESVVIGNPANPITSVRKIKSKKDKSDVYPWRFHFDRGMPWEGLGYEQWSAERRSES